MEALLDPAVMAGPGKRQARLGASAPGFLRVLGPGIALLAPRGRLGTG